MTLLRNVFMLPLTGKATRTYEMEVWRIFMIQAFIMVNVETGSEENVLKHLKTLVFIGDLQG